jgi:hypothetical protein
VQTVTPVPGGLEVTWGTATDADSPPVTYNLYIRDASPVFTDPDTPHEDTWQLGDVTSPYTISELCDPSETYYVVVRCQDSPEYPCEPNEDDNTVELSGVPDPPEITLSIDPEQNEVYPGTEFTLDIRINSSEVAINGLSVYLNIEAYEYDCDSLIQVVNDPPFVVGDHILSLGTPLENGVLEGEPCHLNFSAAKIGEEITGEGVAASLTLRAMLPEGVDEAYAYIYFNFDDPPTRDTSVSRADSPFPVRPCVSEPATEIIITQPPPIINVVVPLQVEPQECARIYFDFCQDGEVVDTIEASILYPGGTGEIILTGNIQPGTYDILAKGWHYLGKLATGVTIPLAEGEVVEFPQQECGDANNDNVISLADFSMMAFFFGGEHEEACDFEPTSPGSEWHADFTGDGVVSLADFSVMSFNFGKEGDTCAGPPEVAAPRIPLAETGVNSAAEFSLQPKMRLLSSSDSFGVSIGEEFEVDVAVKNVTDLYSYSLEVIYDGNSLELLSSADMAAREGQFLVQNVGNKPSLFIARQEDYELSQRLILAGSVTGQQVGAHGDGVVATLRFRSTSENPGTISLKNVRVADHNLKQNLIPERILTVQAVPKHTIVLQNYPNPFNPETWIPYNLANDADVSIRIYNASGQLIQKLEIGRKSAGYYVTRSQSAYWDGRNESGEFVSSGIYFYTIQAGNFTATRKMVLLK